MKKEKYISLDLAKEIDRVAKEKGITLPESEAAWHHGYREWEVENIEFFEVVDGEWGKCRQITLDEAEATKDNYKLFGIPAYDTYELGEIMPTRLNEQWLEIHKGIDAWNIFYSGELNREQEKTEPEARGKILLYLLKNDLLK